MAASTKRTSAKSGTNKAVNSSGRTRKASSGVFRVGDRVGGRLGSSMEQDRIDAIREGFAEDRRKTWTKESAKKELIRRGFLTKSGNLSSKYH